MKITTLAKGEPISAPGAYVIHPDLYQEDPLPDASLRSSIAKTLIAKSPWHAWTEHPRLNPNFEREEETKFDLGSCAHTLMLGAGKRIHVESFKDWRTDFAKNVRKMLRDDGNVPVLAHQYEEMAAMVAAGRAQLKDFGLERAFAYMENGNAAGYPELVIAWQEGTAWCRSMIDWTCPPTPGLEIFDYKSKNESVNPASIGRVIENDGWDVQAAFQERGLDALDPDNAGRRTFFFIAQETEPPYALVPYEMSEAHMTMGRKKVDYAITRWQECMKTGRWPSYCDGVVQTTLDPWAEKRWLERELLESGTVATVDPRTGEVSAAAARNLRAG